MTDKSDAARRPLDSESLCLLESSLNTKHPVGDLSLRVIEELRRCWRERGGPTGMDQGNKQ